MKKLIIVVLTMCMAFCMFACGSETDTQSGTAESSQTESNSPVSEVQSETESKEESKGEVFTVTVVDENSAPVSGVMIQVCKDTCIPAKTDENGVATFNVEITDGYKLSVLSCPEGYEYTGEAEIYLESGITEYTVEISAK